MKQNTPLIKVKDLLRRVGQIQTSEQPIHRGNSGAIWPIILPNGAGEETTYKTNPITMTPDAMSVWSAAFLDERDIDRSVAMRFGLSFWAWLHGDERVKPDVVHKLDSLLKGKDSLPGSAQRGIVRFLADTVRELPPNREE